MSPEMLMILGSLRGNGVGALPSKIVRVEPSNFSSFNSNVSITD
jgi:hypothetical protein